MYQIAVLLHVVGSEDTLPSIWLKLRCLGHRGPSATCTALSGGALSIFEARLCIASFQKCLCSSVGQVRGSV